MQYLAALCLIMGLIVWMMAGEMKVKLFHKDVIKIDALRLRHINAALKKATPEHRKEIKKMRAFHVISLILLYSGGVLFIVWLLKMFLK